MWSPIFVSNGTRIVYLASLISIYILIAIFCLSLGISEVCLRVKYDNAVLHRLAMFRRHFTNRLTSYEDIH